jgi:16S rRNA (uracil1498-N3)-methyltransferase
MLRIDGRPVPRLYVEADLGPGRSVPLIEARRHYLTRVMRLAQGDRVVLFNGRDGEWLARLDATAASLESVLRAQTREPDIWLLFTALKKERLRFLVEKASELGVAVLVPVLTEFTGGPDVRPDKVLEWAREAAEQCGRLSVPVCDKPRPLESVLAGWDEGRCLILADETGTGQPAMDVFRRGAHAPAALLVGPEGGLSARERERALAVPVSVSIGLGPRILRSETAALVALAYWQAAQGDGRAGPVLIDAKDASIRTGPALKDIK